jgi:hypothetical protein
VKGKTGSWKKRARGSATDVANLEIHVGGRETREAGESASSGESVAPKKGRLSITLAPHEKQQQTVAGIQPCPEL